VREATQGGPRARNRRHLRVIRSTKHLAAAQLVAVIQRVAMLQLVAAAQPLIPVRLAVIPTHPTKNPAPPPPAEPPPPPPPPPATSPPSSPTPANPASPTAKTSPKAASTSTTATTRASTRRLGARTIRGGKRSMISRRGRRVRVGGRDRGSMVRRGMPGREAMGCLIRIRVCERGGFGC